MHNWIHRALSAIIDYMSDTAPNYLLFAGENNEPEIFYTIEGEGRYVGYPSVFLRLFGCNLTCAGFASKSSPFGCDSYLSWSKKNKLSFDDLFKLLEDKGYIQHLFRGAILKITGGEPLLRQQPLLEFIKSFAIKYQFVPRIDFETNGTIMPDPEWVDIFSATFTTSPKLSNNGDPIDKRYNPEVLRFHVANNSCFKFVVSNSENMDEILKNYINHPDIKLPRSLVWLMPCCGSREEHTTAITYVADMCKEYNFKLSPRLHLVVWDKALRV